MYVHPKRGEPDYGSRPGHGSAGPALDYSEALAEIGVKAFSRSVSRVLAQVEQEGRLIVTRQNRPIALILSVDEAEEFFLAHAPELVRTRVGARSEWRSGTTVSLDSLP
jgi:prevent-host-death family protein